MPRATMAVANIIPIIALIVGIYASLAQAERCSWVAKSNTTCIKIIDCINTGTEQVNIDIWENCEKNSWLFTKTETQIFNNTCKPFTLNGNNVTLKDPLDAEQTKTNVQNCFIIKDIYTTIKTIDIDEYQPTASIDPIYTVNNFYETDEIGKELLRFTVTDDDQGETASIRMTDDNEDNTDNEAFEFSDKLIDDNSKKEFVIKNKIPIDFEKKQYYKLKYILQSSDESGNSSGPVKHEVSVFVQDASDNPPFWVHPVPSLNLAECDAETIAFTVTAQDRDVNIDNNITYSITEGNVEGYFSIDPDTGVVTTLNDIDRENITTTTFALTIKATEDPSQPSVNGQDYSIQVTNIYISDINDNVPEFDKKDYTFEMDELDELSNQDFELHDLNIFVFDMDEGNNGTYTVTTSNNTQLQVVTPEGRLNSSVTLKAIHGYFNYEKQKTLEFTLTATEKANTAHKTTATLKITIRDINDNKPKFDKPDYNANIHENETEGFSVITVTATDADITETFGNSSIRYYFQGNCKELKINEISGEVTVSSSRFNYEEQSTVTCKVQARDSYGEGSYLVSSDVELTITVNDVADGVPDLSLSNEVPQIAENKTEELKLCDLKAKDEDAAANIKFKIDWDNSDPNIVEIKDWFYIPAATKDGEFYFISQVMARPLELDRDVLEKNQISLRIVATDEASGENSKTEDLTFNITDINDCRPEFSFFPNDIKINEYFNDMSPGCQDGDSITNITAIDKDENPTISFSLFKSSDYVAMDSTGHITVKNASLIDRENVTEFTVDIIIKDGDDKHNNMQTLTVKVVDLNDNTPTFNMSICNTQYNVSEDAEDGTPITTVIADDLDEGPHGLPLYRLLNVETNYRTPFTIDKETGRITTFNNSERFLDREETPFWNLKIRAQDQCESNNFACEALQTNSSTDCTINVTVLDVNDCRPDNFKIVKGDNIVDKITVSESVKAEDDLGYEIRAKDDDEPDNDNSIITYNVKDIYIDSDLTELFPNITFIAETFNRTNTETGNMEYYCTLRSKENLMHLRGSYYIVIEATDGGEEPLSNSITWDLEVTDANDYPPEFDFKNDCSNNTFIIMQENNIKDDWLNCSTSDDDKFIFKMNDDDWDSINQDVEVKILLDNSTTSPNATQLGAFEIQNYRNDNKMYGIKVKEEINREQGSWYNLTILAQDCVHCTSDEPKLEQVHYLMIRITNVFEFKPIFNEFSNCNSNITKCEQVIYIPENAKAETAEADFMEAYDEDNKGGDETQPVYYVIVAVYPDDGKIRLKDDKEKNVIVAENLDREIKANYTVTIDTYNDKPYDPIQPLTQAHPNRLFLTVMVLDKYDNQPEFKNNNNVTFGSFMPTDDPGKVILTIEALDVDLNETLLYSISGNFTWPESEPPQNSEQPFRFEEQPDSGNKKSKLLLNFNPKGQSGFCTFPITVIDKGDMTCVTEVKIFSITENLQVPFYYKNTTSELQAMQDELQASLSLVFELECKIDNIEQPAGKHIRAESDGLNIVMTHFINTTLNTVVEKHVIERMATSEKVFELTNAMEAFHLELRRIGDNTIKSPVDNSLYMILLGVALGIVSLMLVLLGFAYHRSTTNLKRQVKAMSATTFGSVSSEINRIGVDSAHVPGSNQFSGEGANPMFNLEDFTIKEDDISSVGSGDSVLVGVEDTEDFRNYGRGKGRAPQPPGKRPAPAAPLEKGLDNPAFTGRSIDQVTAAAPPSAFDSTTRINPLLQLGDEKDLTDSLADYQFTVTRRSSSDMDDDDPVASALNSNFSFN